MGVIDIINNSPYINNSHKRKPTDQNTIIIFHCVKNKFIDKYTKFHLSYRFANKKTIFVIE